MNNQTESKPLKYNKVRESAKALVATDVAITQKAVLKLRYGLYYKFERSQVLVFGCKNGVA
jgi:hypothetical protein